METASDEFYTKAMEISPRMAEEMLKRNRPVTSGRGGGDYSNRPLRAAWVNQLVEKIKGGYWQHTHQGIAFYKDGTLADGQHRLNAISLAGHTVRMNVTFGLDREKGSAIDTGRKRLAGDVLAMAGETDGNTLAGALRILWLYEEGFQYGMRQISPEMIARKLEEHPDLRRYVGLGRLISTGTGMTKSPATAAAYITGRDKDDPFYEGLLSGVGLQQGDPRLAFRRAMTNAIRLRKNRSASWQLALFGKTVMAYEAGRNLTHLAYRVDEQLPRWGRYARSS